ncbi:uncharacterized protein N7443_008742 [Penicillium atrosanguineum]|uniref:uncharacterized protein n=1 Tax=Penicillium atrosanguineum TaxID=1132637 RepID=UPI002391B431|nr:uncharacterized protein N7443_008742 [Penicillium atrosanguineum]KAJ5292789.1 hypothetical protein N7443_008742 [Penicillium atrosanguineum]
MPGPSRSRDRHGGSRDRARERERRRERDRERDYIAGRYADEGASSPEASRGKYKFRGDAYDSGTPESDYEDERRREHRERRRRRDEERAYNEAVEERRRERAYNDAVEERRRDRSKAKESPATSPVKKRDRERDRDGRRRDEEGTRELEAAAALPAARKHKSTESTSSASHLLSANALAKLASGQDLDERPERSRGVDRERERERSRDHDEERRERRRRKKAALAAATGELGEELAEGRSRRKSGARVASGSYLEEGRSPEMKMRRRGGGGPAMDEWKEEDSWEGSYESGARRPFWKFWANWSRKKRIVIGSIVAVVALLAVVIPVAIIGAKNKSGGEDSGSSDSSSTSPGNSNLDGMSEKDIPAYARGTYLDPFTWYDTDGFNVTFTNETVGGLSIMGLNSTWSDTARPNDNVPPLNEKFPYGSQPIRGVNLGGWLSIEPFITPSLFDSYSSEDGIIDEWTLTTKLGSAKTTTIEKHYATFITESDFAEIKEAGLDHVRIQYSYWAVKTYDGDPYVAKQSWRYLLRAIEYCRKYGLRVNLDLHGIPGSQNGWNHSGRQGKIGWMNGTDGDLNRQRSLEIHDQLSTFFAQDRYKNVVAIYGLVNEPLMLSLSTEAVLNWTQEATDLVRNNGVNATIVFHDGFLNLDKWDTMFKTHPDNMYLDTHQYTTFNTGEIVLNHTAKIDIICNSWKPMIKAINITSTGWGPTICGEWSQADTDCAQYVNNVNRGTRWEGTYDTSSSTAYCPTADDGTCICSDANADVSEYSDAYKKWLQTYAEAQMAAFEAAQGWFYWTWQTESAAQWSYRTAWKNGFMPSKAYSPSFTCGDTVPDFSALGLEEYY